MKPYAALTLDLDDTLWPIAPVIARAEERLFGWLHAHAPEAAAAHPIEKIRLIRDEIYRNHPELAHDFSEQRRLSLRRVLFPFGHSERDVESAYEIFIEARNQVELYPEALANLRAIAEHYPLVAISNGNACLKRIGLDHYFVGALSSRDHGKPKPSPCIWHAAAQRFAFDPAVALHVGDHPEHDVLGALDAGLHAAWISRESHDWPLSATHPEGPTVRVRDMQALREWLDVG